MRVKSLKQNAMKKLYVYVQVYVCVFVVFFSMGSFHINYLIWMFVRIFFSDRPKRNTTTNNNKERERERITYTYKHLRKRKSHKYDKQLLLYTVCLYVTSKSKFFLDGIFYCMLRFWLYCFRFNWPKDAFTKLTPTFNYASYHIFQLF